MKKVSSWVCGLLLLGLMACEQTPPPPTPVVSIDTELAPYVDAFLAEGRQRGREFNISETGLTVEFSNQLDPGVAGICYFGDYLVQIDQLYWNTLSEDQKEFLMHHELGHCLLRRVHLDRFFDDGVPRSIMKSGTSSTTISANPVPFFGFRKRYYLDELFELSNLDESTITRRFAYADSSHQTRRLIWEDSLQTRVLSRLDAGLNEFQIDLEIEELPELGLSVELAWGSNEQEYFLRFRESIYQVGTRTIRQEHPLFLANKLLNYQGRPLETISIRQDEQFVYLFFNEAFIFYLDKSTAPLTKVSYAVKNGADQFSSAFPFVSLKVGELD